MNIEQWQCIQEKIRFDFIISNDHQKIESGIC